jgi:predicted PurR-regulated permease PerM
MLAILGYLSYQIFQPFLTPIAWAVVFCVIFYPVYAYTLRYIRFKVVASLVTLVLILVVIIGPFSYISYALVNEVSNFVSRSDTDVKSLTAMLSDERVVNIFKKVQPYTGLEGPSEEVIIENTKKIGQRIVERLSSGFSNVLSVAGNFVVMAFTIFFFLKDGPAFLQKIRNYLPFSEQQRERLTSQIKDMIVSTIYGGVIVAMVQGILGGAAFAVLGIGSPIFWGSAMALMSFVPLLGTSIIWLPASAILLFEGAYVKGIGLILIGIFVISMVDNILKPLIIGGRTKMPTVVIFFTVLGGIKVFGLLGLVMGPLVFALFLSVVDMVRTIEGEARS